MLAEGFHLGGIFISYRRDDSSGYAGRIHESLRHHFGDGYVFVDFTSIQPGDDFAQIVERRVAASDALLVLIGKWWGFADSTGKRRIDDPHDLMRLEIATALRLGVRVVPLLVAGAAMPSELPPDLASLAKIHALRVRDDAFDESMRLLVSTLRREVVPVTSQASLLAAQRELEAYRAGGPPVHVMVKLALIGASGVGKTSLVRRFISSKFSDSYLSTVGVKIEQKRMLLGAKDIQLVIWDLAESDENNPPPPTYIRGAEGILCVADGTRRHTWETALALGQYVRREIPDVLLMLAVNKADLVDEWQVTHSELEACASSGWTIFTTSAKTGKGVEEMFTSMARLIAGRWGPVLT